MVHIPYHREQLDTTAHVLQNEDLTIVGVNVKMHPSRLFSILRNLFHEGREQVVVEVTMSRGRVCHGDQCLDDYSGTNKRFSSGKTRGHSMAR